MVSCGMPTTKVPSTPSPAAKIGRPALGIKQVPVRVRPETWKDLRDLASTEGNRSAASLIREILENFVATRKLSA